MCFREVSLSLCGLLLGLAAAGQATGQAPDKTGLPINTRAPAFVLKDQSGIDRSLIDFLKKGKVALVFYRSASW